MLSLTIPPPNGVPDPTFTNGHKAWSPWSTVVCRLTPSPLTFGRPRKALSRTQSGTKRKSYGTVFSNLLRLQPEKDPFWWKWTENAAKIKHRLQPCRSAQQSVIIEFSLALIRSQKKTRFGENELKMQPRLSTGYSHAAQLNKVS